MLTSEQNQVLRPTLENIDIGDVLCVSTGCGVPQKLIKMYGILRCLPALSDHVAVVHHQTDGVWWCLEGRPGGVGWVDARRYLADPATVSNVAQPKTQAQRAAIATNAEAMLGRRYDWRGIGEDTARALGLPLLFAENWAGLGSPGQVVCSSYAAWLYAQQQLAHPLPQDEPHVTPAHWTNFCLRQAWLS